MRGKFPRRILFLYCNRITASISYLILRLGAVCAEVSVVVSIEFVVVVAVDDDDDVVAGVVAAVVVGVAADILPFVTLFV